MNMWVRFYMLKNPYETAPLQPVKFPLSWKFRVPVDNSECHAITVGMVTKKKLKLSAVAISSSIFPCITRDNTAQIFCSFKLTGSAYDDIQMTTYFTLCKIKYYLKWKVVSM